MGIDAPVSTGSLQMLVDQIEALRQLFKVLLLLPTQS
jgi:hypothetical protein